MNRELEIWRFIEAHLEQNQTVVLMIVVQSSGSSPGRQGFKMAVAENGNLFGSIGGGLMEVSLVELAKLKIKNEELRNYSEIIDQIHQKNSANPSGMICSGKQTVILYKLSLQTLSTIHKIIRALKNHQPINLQISNFKFQISDNQTNGINFRFTQSSGNDFIYEEKLGFKQNLFIIGGGHCALALSELMSKMDFYILLFDDRPNLNTLEKNKFAHSKKIIESYENIDEFIKSGENNYVVVMTLGYKFDETVIRRLFDRDFKYFGVLGSKSKMRILLQNLEKEGFDKERLSKIRTPIGLPINSHTPEEIAVSIAAEIIAVKNSNL